jgi:hypothetical protein
LRININNLLDDARKKFITLKNLTIELNGFEQLLKVVTKNNGEYEINDRNKIYIRNHYKSWLENACNWLFRQVKEEGALY